MRNRIAVAALLLSLFLIGLIRLLMLGMNIIWFPLYGGVAGAVVGASLGKRRSMAVGAGVGVALGAVAPFRYLPFWLIFTLPPHPEVDL